MVFIGDVLDGDVKDLETQKESQEMIEKRGNQTDSREGGSRHGSPEFYKLLEEMAETHNKKSHDYASNKDPFGNYHFAGKVAVLFSHSPEDAGFAGRIAEKIFRIANLESSGKTPTNESIQDTEIDIVTIAALWMASRRERRNKDIGEIKINRDADAEVMAIRFEPQISDNGLIRIISYLEECRKRRLARDSNIKVE